MQRGWAGIGAAFAWTNGIAYFLGAVLFFLVELDVITKPPVIPQNIDGPSQILLFFGYLRERWAQDFLGSVFFAIAFLSLVPIGATLRQLFGRDEARNELIVLFFAVAGVLGFAGQLLWVGAQKQVLNLSVGLLGDPVISLNITRQVWEVAVLWLQNGVFVTAGLATLLAGRAALATGKLHRSWGQLSLAITVLYLAALSTQIYDAATPFLIVVGIGAGLAGPAWAIWLAIQLRNSEIESMAVASVEAS